MRSRSIDWSIESYMRIEKQYHGHTIQATSLELRTGDYTVHYNVVTDKKEYSDDSYMQSGKAFTSEKEALDAGIQMGEELIDSGLRPSLVGTTFK